MQENNNSNQSLKNHEVKLKNGVEPELLIALKATYGPFYTHIKDLEKISETKDPSLKDIFKVFGPDGHYVLILFLVIPFLQPIPLFGLSTILGLIMILVSCLAFFNKPPWLPEKWGQKSIQRKTILMIAAGAEKIIMKIKFLIHPRLKFLYQGPFLFIFLIVMVYNAAFLALPLPIPFSNVVPAVPILLLCLGRLEDDGLLALIAYLLSALGLILVCLVTQGAILGAEMSLQSLKIL